MKKSGTKKRGKFKLDNFKVPYLIFLANLTLSSFFNGNITHCVKSVRRKKSDKFYGVAEQFSAELKGAEKMQCVNIKFADFFLLRSLCFAQDTI